jgi:predicted alpha/beta hydrolase
LDIAGVIKWVTEQYPDERLYLVGHSMGGQLLGLASNVDCIDRVLFVAVQSGYWRLFRAPYKYGWALLWYMGLPALVRIFGYFPARILGLGANLPAGVAREFGAWCRDPCYLVGASHGVSREDFARLRASILAYSIEDDAFAPQEAVDSLLQLYVNAHIERRHIEPKEFGAGKVGHFGFFRRRFASSLWPPTLEWFKKK